MNISKEKINGILRILFGIVFSILLILFWVMMKSGIPYSRDILRNYLPETILKYLSGAFEVGIIILILVFLTFVIINFVLCKTKFILGLIRGIREKRKVEKSEKGTD